MGQAINKIFDDAGKIGGIAARVALARHALMSSRKALEAPDSPDLVAKFAAALEKVKLEFRQDQASPAAAKASGTLAKIDQEKLRRALAALELDKAAFIGDVAQTIKRVTQAAANELAVARASVWFLVDAGTAIECIDLFERPAGKHSSGLKLFEKDFPAYFKALKHERAIDANDANVDLRTSCFSESYLRPLGIVSMLDIPIWHGGQLKGVLCQEHIGNLRRWAYEEADFGVELANLVSQALK